MQLMELTENEKERYSRHIMLSEVGEEGQQKIKEAGVLVVGAGGLGSPVLLYLAAAGVGRIGIIDPDTVSESNLQRQVLYDINTIGQFKTKVATDKLQMLNPYCRTETYPYRLDQDNAQNIIEKYDIVVDATDNLISRYIIDDACVLCGKPFVYGSICEFDGQVSVFNYNGGPTYRSLFEFDDNVPTFTQPQGVLGTLPGIVGSIQASETLKIILGKNTLSGKLLIIDLLQNTFQVLSL